MSVYRRKSGRYAVLVDLESSATGLRRRKSLGTFATKREAERAEREALAAKDRGIDLDPEKVTIAELAERFIKAVAPELAGQTVSRYEEHLRMHLVPSIGGIVASNLKPAHLAGLYAKLRTEKIRYEKRTKKPDGTVSIKERYGRPLGPTTVLRIHRLMHRMLGWAERLGIVTRNVARIVDAPKAVPSQVRALTADQVATFLAVAEGSDHYAFFVLAVATGMRRGEIGALTWDAIDTERGTAVVRQAIGEDRKGRSFIKSTKSGRERVVPLNRLAIEALRRHRAAQNEEKMRNRDRYLDQDLVFADDLGGMLDLDGISKLFAALARMAGIKTKGVSLHSCRHFSATQALFAGNDVRTVAALLGHASPSTTLNVYGHVVAGAQEQAVAGIEDAITAAQARRAAGQN